MKKISVNLMSFSEPNVLVYSYIIPIGVGNNHLPDFLSTTCAVKETIYSISSTLITEVMVRDKLK